MCLLRKNSKSLVQGRQVLKVKWLLIIFITQFANALAPPPINFTREVIRIDDKDYTVTFDRRTVKIYEGERDYSNDIDVKGWDGAEVGYDYKRPENPYKIQNEGPPDKEPPEEDWKERWRSYYNIFLIVVLLILTAWFILK